MLTKDLVCAELSGGFKDCGTHLEPRENSPEVTSRDVPRHGALPPAPASIGAAACGLFAQQILDRFLNAPQTALGLTHGILRRHQDVSAYPFVGSGLEKRRVHPSRPIGWSSPGVIIGCE